MHFFSNFHLFVSVGKTMSPDKRILKVCMLVFEEEGYKKAREFKVMGKDLTLASRTKKKYSKAKSTLIV